MPEIPDLPAQVRSLRANMDEVVAVAQPEPTAGYRWSAETIPPGIEELKSLLEAAPSNAPGAQATRQLRFVAHAPGHYRFTVSMRQPWEAKPDETLEIDLSVDP